jgi:hypothetical protein
MPLQHRLDPLAEELNRLVIGRPHRLRGSAEQERAEPGNAMGRTTIHFFSSFSDSLPLKSQI